MAESGAAIGACCPLLPHGAVGTAATAEARSGRVKSVERCMRGERVEGGVQVREGASVDVEDDGEVDVEDGWMLN